MYVVEIVPAYRKPRSGVPASSKPTLVKKEGGGKRGREDDGSRRFIYIEKGSWPENEGGH